MVEFAVENANRMVAMEREKNAALELKPGASDEEVKAAFRRLAHVYHPDKASSAAGRAEARFNFNRITAARNRLLGDGGPGGQTRGWTAHNTGMSAAHMGNARRAGRISNAAFAAVLLDLTMPDMTGEDVLRAMRARGLAIPVVLSSGFTEPEVMQRFDAADVVGFVKKPYLPDELVTAVARGLAK